MNNQNNPQVITSYIGTLSTAGVYPLVFLPRNFVVTGIKLLDQAGIAASDTDYVTLTVKKASTSLATLDTRAANNGAVTANTAKAFTIASGLSGTTPVANMVEGDLTLTYAEGGTGTLTLAKVQVEGYWK